MAKLVLFSGGCNSGKTTTLKAVAEKLRSLGYEVEIIDEQIRKETNLSIDELRKDTKAYLQMQTKIIESKMAQEQKAIKDESKKIYLADRAVTDSLFYLENYVDKTRLDKSDLYEFYALHNDVTWYLKNFFKQYSLVIEFTPITMDEDDKYRPKNLSVLKLYEYKCISRLNYLYSTYSNTTDRIMRLSLNHVATEIAADIITRKIINNYGSIEFNI